MPTPLIKICGIREPAVLDAAVEARADYLGLMFYAPSPRNVALPDAAALAARNAGRAKLVGVFVDATDATIHDAAKAASLDVIQLHGHETPARAAQLRGELGIPVWKVVSVASAKDIARAEAYAGAADMILFDAKTPKGTLPGGMGLVFDWSLLAAWRGKLAWGLAGGLAPDNVADAARATAAPLVDVSSGVESAPGVKDADKIAAFCKAIRAAL
ncbi:phosphoribosylanthranilate isomerase [Novosphingobium sp.]|uniref:phosphoribosylanthranilate isomerase n=1 Tax=Novosphingobium sp. TaxID=1874826 RepID=UPI0025F4FE1A|nr:phosphoribosylanthranilate isomerase [Novosphingobium sp.]